MCVLSHTDSCQEMNKETLMLRLQRAKGEKRFAVKRCVEISVLDFSQQ